MSAQFELTSGLALLAGQPHVFHCHHYNVFLQRTIEELPEVDGVAIQFLAAEEVAFPQLKTLLQGAPSDRLSGGAALFQELGFGLLDIRGLTIDGGTVTAPISHYASGWRSKYGGHKGPACHFVRGYLAALTAAAHGKPAGSYDVEETSCSANGGEVCTFAVNPANRQVRPAAGAGVIPVFDGAPRVTGNIDEAKVISTLASMPIVGNEEGMIPAFGVYLTRHYANYYNRISYEFERMVVAARGVSALELVETLLVEAGHVCAFNTFGGIMTSPEWEGLIRPMIQQREDWAHGIVAVVNALGWGRWTIDRLEPNKRLEVSIEGSYESNGYLAMYGKADAPKCHLACGGVAGIMNLLYVGDITQGPALTEEYYKKTFTERAYYAREIECRSQGADRCRFVAEPLTY